MRTPLRLVFMGSPEFASPALEALCAAGHVVAAVYCQPPKPAQRGQKTCKTAVHLNAEALGLEVRAPRTLRDPSEQAFLASLELDAIVVAAYGLILPQAVLDIPRLGCLNIHGSLLPRWRGAAPIHRALLAGDAATGITIMRMEAGLDTGPMLLKESMEIARTATSASLHDDLAEMGARLIVQALALAQEGFLVPQRQDEAKATYAAKLTREEGRINWTREAMFLERQVRALTPWPGSFFLCGEENVKVLETEIVASSLQAPCGTLLDAELSVACKNGALRLTKVQRPGKTPTDGASFLRGVRIEKGFVFP